MAEKTLWICTYLNERNKHIIGIIYAADRAEAEAKVEANQEKDGRARGPVVLVEHPNGAIVNKGFYPGKVGEDEA